MENITVYILFHNSALFGIYTSERIANNVKQNLITKDSATYQIDNLDIFQFELNNDVYQYIKE